MKHLRLISWFTQLALSVVTPLVLCILASIWIHNRYHDGGWVIALGALLGVGAAFGGLIDSLHSMDRLASEDEKEAPVSFNHHS